MRNLCRLFGKSWQAYYQQLWQQEKNALQQDFIVRQVIWLREQLPGVGTGKLHRLLSGFLADHQNNWEGISFMNCRGLTIYCATNSVTKPKRLISSFLFTSMPTW